RSDRTCADVRPFADVGVADVRQMRHLRAFPDPGVLDLDERAGPRPGGEVGSGSEVAERADADVAADPGVDRDRVRADLGTRLDAGRAAEDRERMHRRVRLK